MVVETCDIALQEAARIINVMRERGVARAEEAAVLDWSDATAARGPRQPQPTLGLDLLRELRLASLDDARQLSLDPALASHGAKPALYIDRLPTDSLRIVFQRMMATVPLRTELVRALRFCSIEVDQVRVSWSAVPAGVRASPAWLWLQRVGSAIAEANGLQLDPSLLPFVADILEPAVPLSQAALDARLALQRKRAGLAEEYVLRLEKERLRRLGAGHFAEAVELVSVQDVCAGYDIQSFEVSGEPRLIEVKCSAGPRDRFFLSDNERRIAEANADAYWLAWVGWAANLPDATPEVCWVKNLAGILAATLTVWKVSPCDTVVELIGDDSTIQTSP
jgi:hypothetical protein